MAVRVAINGFGRIGRLAFRQMFGTEEFQVVAINDLASPRMLAHLLKYDSTQGTYLLAQAVKPRRGRHFGGGPADSHLRRVRRLQAALGRAGGGRGTGSAPATPPGRRRPPIWQGQKVVISAPAGEDVPTIVYNVNHHTLKPEDRIVSAASCTTNCLAPMAKALNDCHPILSGIMCTIHGYTGDQMTLDGPPAQGGSPPVPGRRCEHRPQLHRRR